MGAPSIQSADVRGTPKAGVDGTEAALALLIEAWERTTLMLNLVLAVGALGLHLIQDTASELPRGTTKSMRWSFIRSPQPVLNHPVREAGLLVPLTQQSLWDLSRGKDPRQQSKAAPDNLRKETDHLRSRVGGGLNPIWLLVPECPHLAGSAGCS